MMQNFSPPAPFLQSMAVALFCSITALLVSGTGEAAGVDLRGEHIQPTLKFSESGSSEELTVERFHVRYQFTHLFAEPIMRFNCRWDKASSGRLRPYDYSRLDRHEGAADYVKRRMANNFSSFSEVGEAVPWDKAGISWGSRFSARVSYRNSRQNIYVLFMCDSIRGPEKPGFGPSMAGSPKWTETFFRDRAGTAPVGADEAKEIFRSLYGITDVKANKGEVDLSEISSFRGKLIHEAREKFPRITKEKEEDEDTLADELDDALDKAEAGDSNEEKKSEKDDKDKRRASKTDDGELDLDNLLANAEDFATQKNKDRVAASRKNAKAVKIKKSEGTGVADASTGTSRSSSRATLSNDDQILEAMGDVFFKCADCGHSRLFPFRTFNGQPGFIVWERGGNLGLISVQKNGTAKYTSIQKLKHLVARSQYNQIKVFGGNNSIYLSFGDTYLQKISLDGDIIWTNSHDRSPHFDMAVLADGGVLYLNETSRNYYGTFSPSYMVGKISSNGTSWNEGKRLTYLDDDYGSEKSKVNMPSQGDGQIISINENGSFLVSVPGFDQDYKPVQWVHLIDKNLKYLSSDKFSAPLISPSNNSHQVVPESQKPVVRRPPHSDWPILQMFDKKIYRFDANGQRLGVYVLPKGASGHWAPQRFNHSNGFVFCAFPNVYNISYEGRLLGKIEPPKGKALICRHANDNSVLVQDFLLKETKDSSGKVKAAYVPAKNFRIIKIPDRGNEYQ